MHRNFFCFSILTAAALLGIAFLWSVTPAFAQKQKTPVAPVFVDRAGLAISGYDAVAYFTTSAPIPGKAEFSTVWNGAKWQFASASNRDLFVNDPKKYAPQFGGYCAWAVSEGYTAPADPKAWKIVDGKLYLNYNADVQKKWQGGMEERITRGEANWPKLHK